MLCVIEDRQVGDYDDYGLWAVDCGLWSGWNGMECRARELTFQFAAFGIRVAAIIWVSSSSGLFIAICILSPEMSGDSQWDAHRAMSPPPALVLSPLISPHLIYFFYYIISYIFTYSSRALDSQLSG